MVISETFYWPILISRKNWLEVKFLNFHIALWGNMLLIWWDLYCILLISSFVVSISSSESITGNGFSADSGIFSSIHFRGSSSSVFRAILPFSSPDPCLLLVLNLIPSKASLRKASSSSSSSVKKNYVKLISKKNVK